MGRYARSPLRYSVAVREGYDSNVFQDNVDPIGSFYSNVGAGVTYGFGSPRLQMTMGLNGGVTYYYSRPGDKMDYNGSLTLSAIYKATSRLLLAISTQTAYLSQPDLDIAGTDSSQNGDYVFSSTSLSGTYQWTRKFSTVTNYNFNAYYYLDSSLNDTQGRMEQTIGQQFRWLLLPKTNIVAEYRVNPINYFQADQDSLGQFFLVGFDQIFNPRATWTLRVGAEQRWLNNGTDGQSTYIGPFAESVLSYQFAQASYLSGTLRYGTEGSGLSGVTQRQTFRTGFTVTHGFTSRISANVGLMYMNNYYDQPNVIPDYYENIFSASVGVSYKITRIWSVDAGYQYTVDSSGESSQSYNRSIAYVGTTLNF